MSQLKEAMRRWCQRPLTRSGLLRTSCGIVGFFIVVAAVLSITQPLASIDERAARTYTERGPAATEQLLVTYLETHLDDERVWRLLLTLRSHHVLPVAIGELNLGMQPTSERFLDQSEFEALLKRALVPEPQVLIAWQRYYEAGQSAGLEALQEVSSPRRDLSAAEMAADAGDFAAALGWCKSGLASAPEHADLLRLHLQLMARLEMDQEVVAAIAQPRYRRVAPPALLVETYLKTGNYLPLFAAMVRKQVSQWTWTMLLAALITGAAWTLFCLHLGWFQRWQRGHWLAAAALVFGFISGFALLYTSAVIDNEVGWQGFGASAANFVYCIVGIGLREELVKLLLFLPLAWRLARRADDLQIITIASLVGLGFAINENIGYFLTSGGAGVVGRFLTANFLHLVLTGYCGFYLVKAMQSGGEAWNDFTIRTLQMAGIHGLYDFLLIDASMRELSWLSMTVYIWLSQVYLRLVISHGHAGRRPMPLTRLFVVALSVVIGTTIAVTAMGLGLVAGLQTTLSSMLGVVFIAYMFFREFDEPIAR